MKKRWKCNRDLNEHSFEAKKQAQENNGGSDRKRGELPKWKTKMWKGNSKERS